MITTAKPTTFLGVSKIGNVPPPIELKDFLHSFIDPMLTLEENISGYCTYLSLFHREQAALHFQQQKRIDAELPQPEAAAGPVNKQQIENSNKIEQDENNDLESHQQSNDDNSEYYDLLHYISMDHPCFQTMSKEQLKQFNYYVNDIHAYKIYLCMSSLYGLCPAPGTESVTNKKIFISYYSIQIELYKI
jgi:hypothetical protein